MNSADTKPASKNLLGIGFWVAPPSGLLLFVVAVLLVHGLRFRGGYDARISEGTILYAFALLTYGLVAIYVVVGVVGLPTAYFLRRMKALNYFTVSIAALCWIFVLFIGLRLLVFGHYVAVPSIASEIVSALWGTLFVAPFVLFSATIFCWNVEQDRTRQFGLSQLLIVITTICASLPVASAIRKAMEPRVVASVDHPNGTRLLVTQAFGEPFETEIFFDDGDGTWRWYYYDHEDLYWGGADCEIEGEDIRLSSPGHRSIQLDTATGECKVSNAEGRIRTYDKSTRTTSPPPILAKSDSS